ncbi:hypothetical protein B0H15DRAFT_733666, partial [Mycena belliarum]
IPGYEDRAMCSHCNVEESLQHILLECTRTGQQQVWDLASDLWKLKTGTALPPLTLGGVLGCGLARLEVESKSRPSGLNRLYRILISESFYLIWRLRNECVISNDGTPPSASEVHNRWVFSLNERLDIDRYLACASSIDKRSRVRPALALSTWHRTLLDERSLPPDWLRAPRVL